MKQKRILPVALGSEPAELVLKNVETLNVFTGEFLTGDIAIAGGRVAGVTAAAETLPEAVREAYRLAEGVRFANRYCRKDIGAKALKAWED